MERHGSERTGGDGQDLVIECVLSLRDSVVSDSAAPWTAACQAHGILQARILEGVAMLSSRGSSQPRDRTQVSRNAGGFFTI